MAENKGRLLSSLPLAAAGFAAGGLASAIYGRYRHQLAAHRRRLVLGSQVVLTTAGPIEYADRGVGPPVLMIHGAGGGYDQGALIGRYLGQDYRLIAPSRFGYLRTPKPAEPTLKAQAAAHLALLDHLGLDQAIIVGASAGAMSAIQLVLMEPARCRALILISGVTQAMPRVAHMPAALTPFIVTPFLNLDFFTWLVLQTVPRLAPQLLVGIPNDVAPGMTVADRLWLNQLLATFFPTRPRRPGIRLDLETVGHLPALPLPEIKTPALVIHAVDDPTVPVIQGQMAAGTIPGAELLLLPRGGHLLLGHHAVVTRRIQAFLDRLPGHAGPVE